MNLNMQSTSTAISGLPYALKESASARQETVIEAVPDILREASRWHSPDNSFDRFLEGHPFDKSALQEHEKELHLSDKLELYRRRFVPKTTCFFRETVKFFRSKILPLTSPKEKIKLASVGCSTGEEPYSLLTQIWEERDRFFLHAYDVNTECLETAQNGSYKVTFETCDSLKSVVGRKASAEIFTEDFLPEESFPYDKEIQFTLEAKRFIRFQEADLRFGALPEVYDIIFLQNVLRHYSKEGRSVVLTHTRNSCIEGALLVCEFDDPQEYWVRDIPEFDFERIGSWGNIFKAVARSR